MAHNTCKLHEFLPKVGSCTWTSDGFLMVRYTEDHFIYTECIQGNNNELFFVLLYLKNASVS